MRLPTVWQRPLALVAVMAGMGIFGTALSHLTAVDGTMSASSTSTSAAFALADSSHGHGQLHGHGHHGEH
jgi:hypothetical protein